MNFYQNNKPPHIEQVLAINSSDQFNALALQIFYFQYENNLIYKQYVNALGIDVSTIDACDKIPFLPVSFFKTQIVLCGNEYKTAFSSSATGTIGASRHYVKDLAVYEKTFIHCFEHFYGNFKDYVFLALLPSYLEREGSSLVYMADYFIKNSNRPESGFFLYDFDKLNDVLLRIKQKDTPTILLGVSFALLEFAEKFKPDLSGIIVMETGGMKGRRIEITREELHRTLCESFSIDAIHSEYGMTELLSQCYSHKNGLFKTLPHQKIFIRELNDPFHFLSENKTGAINVIDLSNIYSCSFIATDDLGKTNPDGNFEILGRIDNSDVRGCNLLY